MASLEQLLCALKRTSAKGGVAPSAVIDRVQEWKSMGENMLYSLANSLSDIDSREEALKLATESLEARYRDLKEKERQLELLDEGRREALQFMEDKLKLKDEKLDKQLKSVSEEIESLEVKQDEVFTLRLKEREKLKEIEKRERELDVMKRSMEERSGEIEKREKEFAAYRDEKLRELTLKEEVLDREKREFAEKIRLLSEEIEEKQKAGNAVIIERSKSAQNSVCRMKGILNDKFKDIESRELMAHKSLSARLNEADLIQESLEKRFKELEDIEKKLNFSQDDKTKTLESKEGQVGTVRIDRVKLRGEKFTEQQKSGLQILENKDEEKKRELELKQVNLVSCEMEHDYKEQDCGEKSLSSERESAQTCVKAKLASPKLDHLREVELKQRLQGSEQPASTAATTSTNQEKSLDLTHALLKDRMTLEMVINGPEKDPELMGNEILKTLSLFSDPAKVVLDTVEMVYVHCSAMVDMEYKERKRTILLLDQLAILSPNIHPLVTEAAIKLAREWKSTISSTKNPLEALVFLNLVAAYKLSSHFDQEELFSLLMVASKHKQTPVLCHTLGLVPRIPGYITKLINEKKFLLASTFVYEYKFQDRFPQADILNNYTAHARFSANETCRYQHNTLHARKMAVGNEIAALRLAIKHISQYGLESDYSPNALAARIKQLESTQAILRRKTPSPSGQMQNQGKGGRCWQKRNWKAQLDQALRDEGRESSNPLPRQGSNGPSSSPASAWTPKHEAMSQPETGGSSNPRFPPVYSVPMHRHVGPYKRRRTDPWMNDGGFRVAQFASSQH